MAIVDVPGLGPVEFPDGTSKADMAAAIKKRLKADTGGSAAKTIEDDAISRGAKSFAADMPWYQQAGAGAGKALSDTWLGARQIVGNASQKEVDESKARDAPLMGTGAGVVGNVAGHVGMALLPGLGAAGVGKAAGLPMLQAAGKLALTAPANLTGAAVSGGLGMSQGAIQPTATGESRLANATIGLAGGAAVPAVGMAGKAIRGAVQPLYEGGRGLIVGRALRGAAGGNADAAITNLRNAQTLVPGSLPTAAEVANSGGIAAMQRAAAAVDNEAYTTRAAQQGEARIASLQGLMGTTQARDAADAARESTAGALYGKARAKGVDPVAAQVLEPQVKNLMERMPSGVMEKARELARVNGEALGPEGSVTGLHYVKLAVDDLLSAGGQTGIGKQTQRGLMQFKNDLLTVVDELSPDYAKGREAYAALSRPINQMDVAGEIADKSIDKLTGHLRPQAYARALSDDTAARATGFGKATLANTMEPAQLGKLEAIKADLARSVAARDMGRGAGSDTAQKLAMTNLMQQSGLPVGLLNMPGLGRLGNWAFSQADDQMKQALATGLLNPAQTARLMEKATPSERAALVSGLLRMTATPAAIGATTGLLNARQ